MHIDAHLDVDMVALESDDTVTVMLDLAAPQDAGLGERPDHAAIVVLDCSGSMSGERLRSSTASANRAGSVGPDTKHPG